MRMLYLAAASEVAEEAAEIVDAESHGTDGAEGVSCAGSGVDELKVERREPVRQEETRGAEGVGQSAEALFAAVREAAYQYAVGTGASHHGELAGAAGHFDHSH